MKQPKEIIIYPKRRLGRKSVYYLSDLRKQFKLGKVSVFTYQRLISQYYNSYS